MNELKFDYGKYYMEFVWNFLVATNAGLWMNKESKSYDEVLHHIAVSDMIRNKRQNLN